MNNIEHNQPNNINIYQLDIDSYLTTKGKHNRLLVGKLKDCDYNSDLHISENYLHNLKTATMKDYLRVARYEGWISSKSKLELIHSESWITPSGYKTTDLFFKVIN